MSCSLFTDDYQAAVRPALGVELFHNFTLLHDDIMDESVIRRNQPTVHHKWNRNIAILSGDAMSIMSYQLISECDKAVLKPVLELFNKTALEVCEGQQLDMNYTSRDHVSTREYFKMIALKTAVLIAASVGIGALLGYAPASQIDQVYRFGKDIGMAFQVRDDYLDVYGDPGVFGKRIGQDILANKKTCLLSRSLEIAEGKDREMLLAWLAAREFDPDEKIAEMKKIYQRLDIEKFTISTMNKYYRNAIGYLDRLEIHKVRKTELRKLVDSILNRPN
jgi:geranylgeranyl diphosphate synthase type II